MCYVSYNYRYSCYYRDFKAVPLNVPVTVMTITQLRRFELCTIFTITDRMGQSMYHRHDSR